MNARLLLLALGCTVCAFALPPPAPSNIVPEASSTFALLVAGGVAVGLIGRRRQR